jgi:hypothetical protein
MDGDHERRARSYETSDEQDEADEHVNAFQYVVCKVPVHVHRRNRIF